MYSCMTTPASPAGAAVPEPMAAPLFVSPAFAPHPELEDAGEAEMDEGRERPPGLRPGPNGAARKRSGRGEPRVQARFRRGAGKRRAKLTDESRASFAA